jgi:hypothetical protein
MLAKAYGVLERNALMVLVFAVLGSALFAAFLPDTFVADTWMTLVAGREVVEHGLPRRETLTAFGLGSRWTDQQWLAQIVLYGAERLGGLGLVAVLSAFCVFAAYAIAGAAARLRGGSLRATMIIFLPVVFAAPWTWTVRAQVLVLPLFAILLALLLDSRERPRRRRFFIVPILALWANLHGSVVMAAALVTLFALWEGVARRRGPAWPGALALLSWAALFVTPYSPIAILRYYRLLLIDPPFADLLTEWKRPEPEWSTLAFGVLILLAAAIAIRRLRLYSLFEIALLVVTLGVALQAVRGVYWFSLVCLVLLPVGLSQGRRLADRPGIPILDRAIVALSFAALSLSAVVGGLGAADRIGRLWRPEAADAVRRAVAATGGQVFAGSKHADWLLWSIPDLRGRVAYDVRFELYRRAQIEEIVRFNGALGSNWRSASDGYRVLVLDQVRTPTHLDAFLALPGSSLVYRDSELAVITRSSAAATRQE